MKHFLLIAFLLSSNQVFAKDAEVKWNNTKLTEGTIKKIQQAQYQYKLCVSEEMKKTGYSKIESRSATEAITKQCEKVLANMRKVYLDVKMPNVIADRHLRKMRTEMTRRVLKQLMFAEAAKKAGK